MAPEIFENSDYDKSVDIWSLGLLLYEMIHMETAFKGKSAFIIFRNIISGKIKFSK